MKRIRIRIDDEIADRLADLRPVLRSRVISTILAAHTNRVDLAALLAIRQELKRLGTLINHTLRISSGTVSDLDAVRSAANIINSLTKK